MRGRHWMLMDVCENGHALREHFASLYHTQVHVPVCPDCGASKDGYHTVRGYYQRKGWFGREFVPAAEEAMR